LTKAGDRERWILFLVLALALVPLARHAWNRAALVEDVSFGCDPFGYLTMARELRRAASEGRAPDFSIETEQTRDLIEFLRASDHPLERWDEFVAPHAHHYFPVADHVAPQYPPGTGAILAFFPEGRAVRTFNRFVIAALLVLGLAGLALAARRGAWIAGSFLALAAGAAFVTMFRAPHGSYSIYASIPVAVLASLVVFGASRCEVPRPVSSAVLAFLAGALVGVLCTIRVASVLTVPAFALALRRRNWPGFALGLGCVGLTVLAWHQHEVAGAWYLPTYNRGDRAWASPSRVLLDNVPYYLLGGSGSRNNVLWQFLIPGLAGLALLGFERRSVRRSALLAALALVPSLVFFLCHAVLIPYYLHVAVLTALLLACGAVIAADPGGLELRFRRDLRSLAALLVLAPGLLVIGWALTTLSSRPRPGHPGFSSALIAAELRDPRSWVWADMTSGSLYYYAGKPGYKITFSDDAVRRDVFTWVRSRGEPQYLIDDAPTLAGVSGLVTEMGGTKIHRGRVFGYDYYELCLPASADGGSIDAPQVCEPTGG
jgi:hypothetical protein